MKLSERVITYRKDISDAAQKNWSGEPMAIEILIREQWDREVADETKQDACNYIVFIDIEGDLDWLYKGTGSKSEVDAKSQEVISEAMSMDGLPCSKLAEEDKVAYKKMLGEAVVLAIEGDLTGARALLKQAVSYYHDRTVERSRIWTYAFTGVFGVAALFATYTSAKSFDTEGVIDGWAPFFGTLGAIVASIRRAGGASTDCNGGLCVHFVNALGHLFCGIVFGLMGVLIMQSPFCPKTLFGLCDDIVGVAVIAFTAGFFETFVPTMLSKCIVGNETNG